MVTLPKRMLPMTLNDMKRLIYSALHSKRPTPSAATATWSPSAKVAAATAVLDAEPTTRTRSTAPVQPSAEPLRFVDAPAQDVIGDIARDAAVPLPKLPPARPMPKGLGAPQGPSLEERRKAKQLRPGQYDPDANPFGRREKELQERRSYLKNFWYAAGEPQEPAEYWFSL